MRRVKDEDDPNRCRGTAPSGQCWNEAIEGSEYCAAHGGKSQENEDRLDYLTQQFERRLQLDADAVDEVKLLRENLLRINMMLAAHANNIRDEASMAANAGAIIDLTMKAEKVTVSLNRLAISSGLLLAKPALVTWGQQIVHAVAEMVEDKYADWEDDLHILSDRVAEIIVSAKNIEEDE